MKTLAFYINKGGCGKTVSTVNTATLLAQKDYKVLVIDLNPQCDCTRFAIQDESLINVSIDELMYPANESKDELDRLCSNAVHEAPVEFGWDIIPGRHSRLDAAMVKLQLDPRREQKNRLVKILRRFKNQYDYCIIDTHNTADLKLLNVCALEPMIIVPVKIDEGALASVDEIVDYLEEIGDEDSHDLHPQLKLLFTQVNRNLTDRTVIEKILADGKLDAFKTTIRNQSKLVTQCSLEHKALVNEPTRKVKGEIVKTVADDYREFVEELLEEK